MNQICLKKLVERCLAHSKYYTDISYFLELCGGEEIKLILSYAFGCVVQDAPFF